MWKSKRFTYSEYVSFALYKQHAKRMLCIMLSFFHIWQYIYINKMWRTAQFSEKLLNTKCVYFILSTACLGNISLSKKNSTSFIINNVFVYLKYPLFFSDYGKALIFPQFWRRSVMSNILIILFWDQLFDWGGKTVGRIDIRRAIKKTFSQF